MNTDPGDRTTTGRPDKAGTPEKTASDGRETDPPSPAGDQPSPHILRGRANFDPHSIPPRTSPLPSGPNPISPRIRPPGTTLGPPSIPQRTSSLPLGPHPIPPRTSSHPSRHPFRRAQLNLPCENDGSTLGRSIGPGSEEHEWSSSEEGVAGPSHTMIGPATSSLPATTTEATELKNWSTKTPFRSTSNPTEKRSSWNYLSTLGRRITTPPGKRSFMDSVKGLFVGRDSEWQGMAGPYNTLLGSGTSPLPPTATGAPEDSITRTKSQLETMHQRRRPRGVLDAGESSTTKGAASPSQTPLSATTTKALEAWSTTLKRQQEELHQMGRPGDEKDARDSSTTKAAETPSPTAPPATTRKTLEAWSTTMNKQQETMPPRRRPRGVMVAGENSATKAAGTPHPTPHALSTTGGTEAFPDFYDSQREYEIEKQKELEEAQEVLRGLRSFRNAMEVEKLNTLEEMEEVSRQLRRRRGQMGLHESYTADAENLSEEAVSGQPLTKMESSASGSTSFSAATVVLPTLRSAREEERQKELEDAEETSRRMRSLRHAIQVNRQEILEQDQLRRRRIQWGPGGSSTATTVYLPTLRSARKEEKVADKPGGEVNSEGEQTVDARDRTRERSTLGIPPELADTIRTSTPPPLDMPRDMNLGNLASEVVVSSKKAQDATERKSMSSINSLLDHGPQPEQRQSSQSSSSPDQTFVKPVTTTSEAADALTTLATLGSGQQYAPTPVPASTRELPSPTAFTHATRRRAVSAPTSRPLTKDQGNEG